MQANPSTLSDQSSVLKKAFFKATGLLGFDRTQIEDILGVSPATLSRLMNQPQKKLDPHSKEGEIALTLIRIFRSLDALFGGNSEQAKLWIHSYNHHLEEKPVLLLKTLRGLYDVAGYLDAIRGKV